MITSLERFTIAHWQTGLNYNYRDTVDVRKTGPDV